MHLLSRLNRLHGFVPGFLAAQPAPSAATGSPNGQIDGWWPILQFAWERCEAFGWQRIGTYLLIATALSLLLLWPFARMIVGRKQVLTRSTLFVGSVIALSAAFLALGYFAMRSESIPLLVAVGVVYVAILLAQTRHIFDVPRAAAAGVLGCYVVLTAVALYGTEQLTGPMPWTEFLFKSKEEQRRVFAEWETGKKVIPSVAATAASPSANPVASPVAAPVAAPATTRAATVVTTPTAAPAPLGGAPNLQALYIQLQKTRAELDTSDPVAVARFNQQAAAYQQEKALAAAYAAPRQNPTKDEPTAPAQPVMAVQNSAKSSRK